MIVHAISNCMDYYSILSVDRNATPEQIKTAYRKLAMTHHPDRGGDHTIFANINSAYDTLKDPHKKAMYDHSQTAGQGGFNFNSQDFSHGDPFAGTPFEHIFRQRQTPRNRDVQLPVDITLNDVVIGNKFVLNYKLSTGRMETVTIDIPPGANHGDTIQYEGLGDEGNRNHPRGNLLVKIRVKKNRDWTRDGDHLNIKKLVNLFDFLTGGVIIVTTLEGKTIKLNIPPGTKPGTTFSITGYGIPNLNTRRRGNIYVQLEPLMPKISDVRLLDEIEELKRKIG